MRKIDKTRRLASLINALIKRDLRKNSARKCTKCKVCRSGE